MRAAATGVRGQRARRPGGGQSRVCMAGDAADTEHEMNSRSNAYGGEAGKMIRFETSMATGEADDEREFGSTGRVVPRGADEVNVMVYALACSEAASFMWANVIVNLSPDVHASISLFFFLAMAIGAVAGIVLLFAGRTERAALTALLLVKGAISLPVVILCAVAFGALSDHHFNESVGVSSTPGLIFYTVLVLQQLASLVCGALYLTSHVTVRPTLTARLSHVYALLHAAAALVAVALILAVGSVRPRAESFTPCALVLGVAALITEGVVWRGSWAMQHASYTSNLLAHPHTHVDTTATVWHLTAGLGSLATASAGYILVFYGGARWWSLALLAVLSAIHGGTTSISVRHTLHMGTPSALDNML